MGLREFLSKLALAAVLTPVVKYVTPLLFGWHPSWWLAAVGALAVVFIGGVINGD